MPIRYAAYATLLAAFAQNLWGQTASITGRVYDSANALVADASVNAVATATGNERSTKSNQQGIYNIPLLLPGEYKLSVQAAGFKTLTRTLRLEVAQTMTLDVKVEVGELTQSIDVTAESVVLQSSTSSLGQHIEGKQVLNLPLLGRNAYALVQLVPGARMPLQFNDTPVNMFSNQFVSVNGARGNQNEYLLDGAPNTNPGQSGPTLFPSADAVAEFRVITNAYSAEYGRAAGGVFNVATRSGANELHGTVFDFLRNDAITANEFFANRAGRAKPPFRFNQFGFTVGGPLVLPKIYNGRNRTFFFGDYEGVRQQQGATFNGTVPTPAERSGDFSQTRNSNAASISIFDPLSSRSNPNVAGQFVRDAFPGNRVPATRMDPVARNMIAFFPQPNAAGNQFTNTGNFINTGPSKLNKDIFGIRVDHRIHDKHQIYGRVSYDHTPTVPRNPYDNIGGPTNRFQTFARRGVVLDDTYIFTPTLVGNFKYGFNRLINDRVPFSQGIDLATVGYPASFARAIQVPTLPIIATAGFSQVGQASVIHFGLDTHSWQYNLTHSRGSHTLKFGGDVRLIRNNEIQTDSVARFDFDRNFTQGPNPAVAGATAGFSLAALMLGTGTGSTLIIPAVALQNIYYALFLQDDWKVSRKLTLNIGLRWDYESPRTDRFNQLANFEWTARSPLSTPSLDLRGGLTFVGVGDNPRGQWNRDLNNFAPRFGFAYQAASRLVVRAGAGVFFAPNFAGTGTGPVPFGLSGFQATTTFVGTLDGFTPFRYLRDPYPDGLLQPVGSSQGLATLAGQNIGFVDRGVRTPYGVQWNLSIQHELAGNILAEVAYVGSRGLKNYANRQFNQLPDAALALGNSLREQTPNPFFGTIPTGPLSARTVARAQLLRPFPHFTDVTAAGSTWGASSYHSGQAKVERRFSRGFSLLGSYTFGKILDDVTGPWAGENVSGGGFQNWNFLRAEKSVSSLDTTHRFTVGGVWELPFGKGKPVPLSGVAAVIAGGWQVNGIWIYASGNVLGMVTTDGAFSQGGGQRPDWDGRSPILDTRDVDKWFATSVFRQPAPYRFGNAPRTIPGLRSDGTANLDFSAIRNTHLHERINLQLRAEWFNFTNTPRFDLPNTNVGTTTAGFVTAQANRPKTLQLALKMVF
ncbi:MAG: TonB-dependent receptor [Acidobacteria bacterium]|nr:TonB-dependent receptor [Acidobacteriota bacterium]